jgi:hypothetical protein
VSQCLNTTTTDDCPTQSKNATALAQNQAIFASICKSASADTATTDNTHANSHASATTTSATHVNVTATAPHNNNNVGNAVTPSVVQVFINAVTILSVLFFGAISVL